MTTQHTSGPWKAVYVGCGDWDLNGPVTQEDWTLAAAAPDLLEALKNLLESHYNGNVIKADCAEAEAAISKATGQE